jgi:hypothetical protein
VTFATDSFEGCPENQPSQIIPAPYMYVKGPQRKKSRKKVRASIAGKVESDHCDFRHRQL